MESVSKFLTKKNMFFLNVGLGVISLIALIHLVVIGLDGVKDQLPIINIFFYLIIIGLLLSLGTSAYLYFGKKDRSVIQIIGMAVTGIAIIILLAFSKMLLDFASAARAEDLNSMIKIVGSMSGPIIDAILESRLTSFIVVYALLVGYGGYNGYLLSKGLTDEEIEEGKETIKEGMNTASEAIGETASSAVASTKSFLKTGVGKATVGGVGVLIVVALGYFIYANFIFKIDVSLVEACELDMRGDSGSGYITLINCDKTEGDTINENVEHFYTTVYYEADDNDRTLKNGDIVTVKAVYSEDYAKELKVNVTNDTFEVTIEGLRERYSSLEDIPSEVLEAADAQMKLSIEEFNGQVKNGKHWIQGLTSDKPMEVTSSSVLSKVLFIQDREYTEGVKEMNIIYVYEITIEGQERVYGKDEDYAPLTVQGYALLQTDGVSSEFIEGPIKVKYLSPYVYKEGKNKYEGFTVEQMLHKLIYTEGKFYEYK